MVVLLANKGNTMPSEMQRRRFKIAVTEADIERAKRGGRSNSHECVVSQAIARTVPGATNIDTDTQTIRFTSQGSRLVYLTPYAVQGYVIAFDAGDPIEPFRFELRNPIKARLRRRNAAGLAVEKAASKARRAAKRARVVDSQESTTRAEDARAAYVAVQAHYRGAPKADESGVKPPPRVFKRKSRSYGGRLLRVNQETA